MEPCLSLDEPHENRTGVRRLARFSRDVGYHRGWPLSARVGSAIAIVGATPHHFQPRYALANLGHPSCSYLASVRAQTMPGLSCELGFYPRGY